MTINSQQKLVTEEKETLIASLLEREFYEDAAFLIEPLLGLENSKPLFWEQMARCHEHLDRHEMAVMCLKIADDLYGGNDAVAKKIALSLLTGDEYEAAAEQARRAFQSNGQITESLLQTHFAARYKAGHTIPRFLNVGGGPSFIAADWLNIDEFSEENVGSRQNLKQRESFPLINNTVELCYSSHCFEHLDDQTIDFILQEFKRVLSDGGAVVIKIPDFDQLLEQYKNNNDAYFSDQLWNFPAMTPTWPSRQIEDTLEARCAYLFCGYWNHAFGHLFDSFDVNAEGAYHGPLPVNKSELKTHLLAGSPKVVVDGMRKELLENETDVQFNHQNAWGRSEFIHLFEAAGFSCLSTDASMIVEQYRHIPGINEMFSISAYFIFVRNNQ